MSTESERPVVGVTTGDAAPAAGAGMPRIGQYWPDLPQRMTPAPDVFRAAARSPADARNRPTLPLPAPATPTRRSGRRRVAYAVVVLVLLAAAAVVGLDRGQPDAAPPVTAGPSAGPAAPPFRITGPRDGRETAVLVLATDASAVRIRAGATAADLFRASSPEGGSVRPVASVTGDTVRLELREAVGSGAAALDVQLSADVRWSVRTDAAINNADVDLSRTRIGELRWAGDAADVALRLPRPDGVLTVTVTGGINRFRVAAPGDTPVRVRAGGGMGRAVIDGRVRRGVAAGQVLETGRWRRAADRIGVDARAGLGEITVERY